MKKKKNRIFSPLSMRTEFDFKIDKDKASEVLCKDKGSIFEDIEISNLRDYLSCKVTYSTTIQRFGISHIHEARDFEKECLLKFLKRYSGLKKNIRKHGELKIKTTVVFIGELNVK